MKGTKRSLLLLLPMLLALSFAVPVFAGTGTITVSGTPPSVTSIAIMLSGGSGNLTAIDVYTWYDVKVVVSEPDQLTDIQRLEVRVYKVGVTWTEVRDDERRQGFAWSYTTPTWQYLTLGGWDATDNLYLDSAGCSAPSLSATSGTWTFKLMLRSLSHYTTNQGWCIEAHVKDKSSNEAWRTNKFDVNLLISIDVPSAVSWTASAGQANVSASGMPFAIQYASNAIVKIQVKATDPTSSFGDHFSASNLLIDDDNNPNSDAHCMKLSNTYQDWETTLGVNYIGGPGQPINAYWFATVPAGQPTGTYTFTYEVNIAFEAFAT